MKLIKTLFFAFLAIGMNSAQNAIAMEKEDSPEVLLLFGAHAGQELLVDGLIAAGIDVNTRNPIHGYTALHYAIAAGHLSIVKKLVAVPSIDVTIQDNDGFSPLDRVFMQATSDSFDTYLEITQELLKKVDPSTLPKLLGMACARYNPTAIKIVLNPKLKLNIPLSELRKEKKLLERDLEVLKLIKQEKSENGQNLRRSIIMLNLFISSYKNQTIEKNTEKVDQFQKKEIEAEAQKRKAKLIISALKAKEKIKITSQELAEITSLQSEVERKKLLIQAEELEKQEKETQKTEEQKRKAENAAKAALKAQQKEEEAALKEKERKAAADAKKETRKKRTKKTSKTNANASSIQSKSVQEPDPISQEQAKLIAQKKAKEEIAAIEEAAREARLKKETNKMNESSIISIVSSSTLPANSAVSSAQNISAIIGQTPDQTRTILAQKMRQLKQRQAAKAKNNMKRNENIIASVTQKDAEHLNEDNTFKSNDYEWIQVIEPDCENFCVSENTDIISEKHTRQLLSMIPMQVRFKPINKKWRNK